ncbi:hypothetical protein CHARACLAT_023609 [Characodon lateralis]|uniref:Uncharacterized protein n=1 Tax=Characodon lateralis TaxID=208331 RepID=A0ABU7ELP0_9TELE|nr:hypothetical protein [Characodon lateralis]
MDLLGEIFDTLSSRSSHERGLLYGTRSLDLFGPDSHDYIIKHGPANPSQESLLLSISGSGSLHSWNLETTEELSDRTEDSDWHCLDTSLLEEEGAECLLVASDVAEHEVREKEIREIEKEKIGEVNGKQEINYTNKCMEVKVEEERSIEDPENMACFEKSSVKEMTEGTEDERIKNTRKDDEIQSGEALVQEEGKKRCDTQENETEEEIIETQNEKNNDSKETLKCINRDDPILNSVKEQQGEATVTPGLVTADPKPPLSQEKKSDNTPIKEEQGVCLTSPPPKVLSAIARFQGQPYSQQGFQLRSIPKNSAEAAFRCREKLQTPCDSDTNKSSEAPEEEDHPPVKVSELKKRFEA